MGQVARMVKMRITKLFQVGTLKGHIEGTYGENCYIKMCYVELLQNMQQECEKSWRPKDNLMKFLPETTPNF